MNEPEKKARALLNGLQVVDPERFISHATVGSWGRMGEMIYEAGKANHKTIERLTARVAQLEEAVRRAPCHQNSMPCSWPCGNDPADHGPCWKQTALNAWENER